MNQDASTAFITRESNQATQSLDLRTLIKATLIFLAAVAIYFISRSPGLDEFDSVNFATGVRGFDLWNDQPHPPGYPIFIFLGWIGTKLFSADVVTSLHLVSSLGGALFIAAWFLIIRLQFTEGLAWWITACLTITPVVFMTATKVLSDTLAAGFLSAEIFAALYFLQRGRFPALLSASLFGATAAGARPQLILVVIVILLMALKQRRSDWKMSIFSASTLIAGCLAWLLPMWCLQARLRPDIPAWLVYPRLLYGQWQWRLDKPHTFIGAGNWRPHYLAIRFAEHILGWFGLGFGLIQSPVVLAIGSVIVIFGLAVYWPLRRQPQDQRFWKFHATWASVHIVTIFICLGGSQRYYLIIFPLLIVALMRGVLRTPTPWNWLALALPALLLYITVPTAIQNHREEPPPIQLVCYLRKLYPLSQRKNVFLLFANARRHVEWYAPEFKTFRDIPPARDLPQILQGATAVYTDDANVPLPPRWRRVPLVAFQRSVIIYAKHHFVPLFLVDRHL